MRLYELFKVEETFVHVRSNLHKLSAKSLKLLSYNFIVQGFE